MSVNILFVWLLLLMGFIGFAVWGATGFRLPQRSPQWCKHQVVKQANRDKKGPLSKIMPYEFVCQICLQRWLSADSISNRCPGLPTYSWPLDDEKPVYYVTARELEVLGYRVPEQHVAYYKADFTGGNSEYRPLYDQRIAVRQAEALPKL